MLPINVNLPLKAVTDRMQSFRAVLWALNTHGSRLIDELGGAFNPLLAEGQVTPFDVQLELFKKKLTLDLDQLVTTDRQYRDQKARESISRGQRDRQAEAVNSNVLGLRQAFTGFYSDEKLAEFGFARRTPKLPGEVQEQASHLVARLNDSGLDLTGSRWDEVKLDAPTMSQELVGSVNGFQQAADDLAREERQTEVLKLAKDDALKRYNQSFLWIARTVESLCQLAGLTEVAKRVRPSVRRPGVTARKFEQSSDAPSEGDASDDGSEGEASSEAPSEAAAADTAPSS